MKSTCFTLDPGGRMIPGVEADALAAWRAGGSCWIDLSDHRQEELAAWLAALGLAPDLIELLALADASTRLLPLLDAVYVSFPIPSRRDRDPARFRFLCLDRLLVTMHSEGDDLAWTDDPLLRRGRLPEPTAAGVICVLAIAHASRLRRHVVTLRGEEEQLADRMIADPWSVSTGEVLALKRRVLALGAVVDEQLAFLEVMKVSRQPLLPMARIADAFQAAVEITRSTGQDLDRLERRLGDIDRRHESAEQDRTNRRLGTLTVLSAIFMPLTLVAGIYGMNFENMPELRWRWGYPATLGAMALLAIGLGWYFRARWWRR